MTRPIVSISLSQRQAERLVRWSLGLIYIWFGLLKLVAVSPAEALVEDLLQATMPFVPFPIFLILLGVMEVGIGLAWLWPRLSVIAAVTTVLHMIMTFGPLVVLPQITWHGWLQPTLEGQYIIKNVSLVTSALMILSLTTAKDDHAL